MILFIVWIVSFILCVVFLIIDFKLDMTDYPKLCTVGKFLDIYKAELFLAFITGPIILISAVIMIIFSPIWNRIKNIKI